MGVSVEAMLSRVEILAFTSSLGIPVGMGSGELPFWDAFGGGGGLNRKLFFKHYTHPLRHFCWYRYPFSLVMSMRILPAMCQRA